MHLFFFFSRDDCTGAITLAAIGPSYPRQSLNTLTWLLLTNRYPGSQCVTFILLRSTLLCSTAKVPQLAIYFRVVEVLLLESLESVAIVKSQLAQISPRIQDQQSDLSTKSLPFPSSLVPSLADYRTKRFPANKDDMQGSSLYSSMYIAEMEGKGYRCKELHVIVLATNTAIIS